MTLVKQYHIYIFSLLQYIFIKIEPDSPLDRLIAELKEEGYNNSSFHRTEAFHLHRDSPKVLA